MEIGEAVAVPEASTGPTESSIHAGLLLKSVTFSSNHVVERDTKGNFSPPEWSRGRSRQWPVCYTRHTTVKLKAHFIVVTSPTATENVTVKGRSEFEDGPTLEWTGSVSVSPGDTEVATEVLSSNDVLPNHVARFERFSIQWEAQAPGEPSESAGTSRNVLYLTLKDPSGTPPYWTLLDISCRGAHGAMDEAHLVKNAFYPFTTRTLRRKRDSQRLTYWNPETTTATNTMELLAQGDGSGQCGSWSELLIDAYKAHGVTSAVKVLVVRSIPEWQASRAGFLVKNWRFVGAGSMPPPLTHIMYTECTKEPGIPGQSNPNPPPAFYNHFIVSCLGDFYDPSYGGGPVTDQLTWENGAIDGIFSGGRAGYPKSSNAAIELLKFYRI